MLRGRTPSNSTGDISTEVIEKNQTAVCGLETSQGSVPFAPHKQCYTYSTKASYI